MPPNFDIENNMGELGAYMVSKKCGVFYFRI